MENITRNTHFKLNQVWIDLGNLKTFLSDYGLCDIKIKDYSRKNIVLRISSEYGLKIQLICSENLSEIIKEEKNLPPKFEYYRIYKIKKTNGNYIIRLTYHMIIPYNNRLTEEQNQNKIKKLKGNVVYEVRVKKNDINKKPEKRKAVFDWTKELKY
jgi:hypothetical protein